MQPFEFIDSLLRHYAKRFDDDAKRAEWTREMVGLVRGTEASLLRRAYEIIRDTHEERAFPLPSAIKRAIDHAGAQLDPSARNTGDAEYRYPPVPRYRDPKFEHTCRLAAEWQAKTIERYGSWAAHWRATGGDEGRTVHEVVAKPELPDGSQQALPRAVIKQRRFRSRQSQDISRIGMRALQRRSRSKHLHEARK